MAVSWLGCPLRTHSDLDCPDSSGGSCRAGLAGESPDHDGRDRMQITVSAMTVGDILRDGRQRP
jgi:hypothetical protein